MAQSNYEHGGEWGETLKIEPWADWCIRLSIIPQDTVNNRTQNIEIETEDIPRLIGWLNEAYLRLINPKD